MNINKRIVFFLLFIAILYSVPAWAGPGWYLLIPPFPIGGVNVEAPSLSQWQYQGSYDSAKECNEDKATQYAKALDRVEKMEKRPGGEYPNNLKGSQEMKLLWTFSRCVASDDPRLKP